MTALNEDDVEQLATNWLLDVGLHTVRVPDIALEFAGAESDDFAVWGEFDTFRSGTTHYY